MRVTGTVPRLCTLPNLIPHPSVSGPFIPALGPGERLPSIGLWGVVLCRVDWTHPGWFPSHWARLGATLGGAVGEPAWDTVTLGTPLLMLVGGFWCSWCKVTVFRE